MTSPLPDDALVDLRRARDLLEQPGLAIRIASVVGAPIERLVDRLPASAADRVNRATRGALERALGLALDTLEPRAAAPPTDWAHRAGAIALGATGGAFGLAGLILELPASTTLMLRSVAEHARSQGEDLRTPAARLECLGVFALGGGSPSDDAAESGYFATRIALARLLGEAAEWVAAGRVARAAADHAAPALVRLVGGIAQRFGAQVTQKVAAQAVPVVGAATGAAINAMFMQHYQGIAWAHFTVRRLERQFGPERVRAAYDAAAVG